MVLYKFKCSWEKTLEINPPPYQTLPLSSRNQHTLFHLNKNTIYHASKIYNIHSDKSLKVLVYSTNPHIPVIGDVCKWGYNILTEYKNELLRFLDPNIEPDQLSEESTRDVHIIVDPQMTRFEVDDWLGQKQEDYPSVPTATYVNLVIEAQQFYERCFNDRAYVESLITSAFNSIKNNPENYRVWSHAENFRIMINDVEVSIYLTLQDRQLTAADLVSQVGRVWS